MNRPSEPLRVPAKYPKNLHNEDESVVQTTVPQQEETADITDEQGRNPGEPGFGDGDDGHVHSEDTDRSPKIEGTDTPPSNLI